MPDLLVLYYPVIDTSKDGYGQKTIGDRWRDLSPVDHVKPNLPPTLLLHGTRRHRHPLRRSQPLPPTHEGSRQRN